MTSVIPCATDSHGRTVTAAAGITVGAWHRRRVPVEAGRYRWLHVPVFALSVPFSLTLASVTLWGLLASSF